MGFGNVPKATMIKWMTEQNLQNFVEVNDNKVKRKNRRPGAVSKGQVLTVAWTPSMP